MTAPPSVKVLVVHTAKAVADLLAQQCRRKHGLAITHWPMMIVNTLK